jgi:UDP-N-acetylglucosamine--N-acetylmuramyl-(pentapeptide) pyrophosphoryl-undecaprenol N-acetylglucosamine transferase
VTVYLLAGGGTAGHVNPLLAVADRLRDRDPYAEILVLGTREGLEARLVPDRGYELLFIERLPFPRRINRAAFSFPARFRQAIDVTAGYLRERKVDVVVGFGGYASAPAYVAARREKIPLAIHEGNAKPGIANRFGARFTRHVGVTFEGTRIANATFVGMPLRREIESLDRHAMRPVGYREFDLDPSKPTLLVTGGSSGARRINDTIYDAIAVVLGTSWQVLHITGANSDHIDPRLSGYRMLRYCDRMDLALAVTDFAVSRAGSATVSEFAALGIPAAYVPYPVGNGEQRFNASNSVDAGGAVLVRDVDFTPQWIAGELIPLLRNRALVADMAARAGTVGVRNAADRMVDLILSAASGN